MDKPRILAIADVHLWAPPAALAGVMVFYADLLGLEPAEGESDKGAITFAGQPRTGPRLIVSLDFRAVEMPPRRALLIEVIGLSAYAQVLNEHGITFEWSRGWSFYDRRLLTQDPAGNRVEVVSSHPL